MVVIISLLPIVAQQLLRSRDFQLIVTSVLLKLLAFQHSGILILLVHYSKLLNKLK